MQKELFECARCGYCCHGETTVSLSKFDQERMQASLALSRDELFEKYLRVTGAVVQMKVVDGHCIFFGERGCQVHAGRPERCREWPLHPSILHDEANLSAISTSCPGINKALPYQEFCLELEEHLSNKELADEA